MDTNSFNSSIFRPLLHFWHDYDKIHYMTGCVQSAVSLIEDKAGLVWAGIPGA